MKKYLLALTLCGLAACQSEQTQFNADEELSYCSEQVNKALDGMIDNDGTYDFTMEPRNILDGEYSWNRRKASEQEWCSGFWPGILWMDYGVNKDEKVRKAAEGYTETLKFLAEKPAFDHDLGFLVINSFLKGYEQTKNEDYHVAVYDTLTGNFLRGQTHQGYADSSMWSRGQSWAIYGYTMVYHHPAGSEIDASIIYADYYYLEALLRWNHKHL